jgi:hypothetical protein
MASPTKKQCHVTRISLLIMQNMPGQLAQQMPAVQRIKVLLPPAYYVSAFRNSTSDKYDFL